MIGLTLDRWMDGLKAFNDREMDVREAKEHARNRNEWIAIVLNHN